MQLLLPYVFAASLPQLRAPGAHIWDVLSELSPVRVRVVAVPEVHRLVGAHAVDEELIVPRGRTFGPKISTLLGIGP